MCMKGQHGTSPSWPTLTPDPYCYFPAVNGMKMRKPQRKLAGWGAMKTVPSKSISFGFVLPPGEDRQGCDLAAGLKETAV